MYLAVLHVIETVMMVDYMDDSILRNSHLFVLSTEHNVFYSK